MADNISRERNNSSTRRLNTREETLYMPSSKEARAKKRNSRLKRKISNEYMQLKEYFEPRKKAPNVTLGIVLKVINYMCAFVVLAGVCVFGAVIGLAKAYMETTPTLDVEKIEGQAVNSQVYDQNGVLFTTFSGMENREWASLENIPENLQKAFISIEDVRFEYHSGVDFKRLAGAVLNNVLGTGSYGGSTITQQLIKNSLLSSEQTYKRKIQEAYLSIQLENEYSKDEILESYLNTIPLGGNIYGIKVAARDYFGKELSELSLRECACLAAMNQAPTKYNPRRVYYVTKDPSALNERIDTVLSRMYAEDYITKDEYQAALEDELYVIETSKTSSLYSYPYFVEYAMNEIIDYLLEKRNLTDTRQNRSMLETELSSNGYKIYLTIDTEMQETVQQTLSNYDKYPRVANSAAANTVYTNADGSVTQIKQPQASAVVFDYKTGELKAIVGGRDEATLKKSLNRASDSTMPVGSAIKPLAVYAPALDKGYSPASIVANVPVPIPGWDTETGYPSTSESTFGPVTLRTGVEQSLNAATARTLMEYVGINDSANYLVSMGIDPSHINEDGPGLALGTSGITTVEMAVAYGCIANGGVYVQPLSFTKVVDRNGETVLDANEIRVKRQVFKPSTAYLITDILIDAVQTGTGKRAQIAGMTVGGKTGTNQENRGVSFSGITPYYSASVYIGHDNYEALANTSGSSAAAPLWQLFMAKIHQGLEDGAIVQETIGMNISEATVCSVSGMLASPACEHDILGRVPITDIFDEANIPTETCTYHHDMTVCTETGLLTTPYCPATNKATKSIYISPKDSALALWEGTNGKLILPEIVYSEDFLMEQIVYQNNAFSSIYCNLHTEAWQANVTLLKNAEILITAANNKLEDETLDESTKVQIQTLIEKLELLMEATPINAAEITETMNSLKALLQ